MRLVRRPTFSRDLAKGYAHFRAHSPNAAENFLQDVDSALELLLQFPSSGSPRPDLREGYRAAQVRRFRYLILYRLAGKDIVLLRIVHGARHLPNVLPKD